MPVQPLKTIIRKHDTDNDKLLIKLNTHEQTPRTASKQKKRKQESEN